MPSPYVIHSPIIKHLYSNDYDLVICIYTRGGICLSFWVHLKIGCLEGSQSHIQF